MKVFWRELKYSFYLIRHPFKGFWDIKHSNCGSLRTALVLFGFYMLTSAANGFYNGFLFNPDGGIHYNLYQGLAINLLLYLLWGASNWCLTSLFDGEGTFRDICKFTSYSLLPLSLAQVLLIPLSHILSLQESSFYTMVMNIGILWTGLLLFIGLVVTHQYTVLKAVVITVVTLLGMCIMVYIILLVFNLIQQVFGFVFTFWRELSLRLT